MRFSSLFFASITANFAIAAPFSFPLANGFPNLNSTALQQVYNLAGGALPIGGLPTTLSPSAVQTLQVIAAGEIFEVAFFTELLNNITTRVPGYDLGNNYDYIIKDITSVINQETIHAVAVNSVLASAGQTTIQPCQYQFPVSDFDSAIRLAQTFTDVALGVLPVAQTLFATDGGGETALVQIIGSVIGQEGEQNGFYRSIQKKIASSAPLLTGAAVQFAFTAVSQFLVPGSCPNINVIGLTPFPALTVETIPGPENSTQLFSINGTISCDNSSIAYISGQNLPVTVPISDITIEKGVTYFFASFPFDSGFARGLTIAALVSGSLPTFNSTTAVADATLYGPALIEVD